MSVIIDTSAAVARLGQRNLVAEVRAVEEGHHCRLDVARHVFVVASDTNPWQYALTARADVAGLVILSCRAEPNPSRTAVDTRIPRGVQFHARTAEPGVCGCKHQAVVIRRLQRAGLVRLEAGRWYATPKAFEAVRV